MSLVDQSGPFRQDFQQHSNHPQFGNSRSMKHEQVPSQCAPLRTDVNTSSDSDSDCDSGVDRILPANEEARGNDSSRPEDRVSDDSIVAETAVIHLPPPPPPPPQLSAENHQATTPTPLPSDAHEDEHEDEESKGESVEKAASETTPNTPPTSSSTVNDEAHPPAAPAGNLPSPSSQPPPFLKVGSVAELASRFGSTISIKVPARGGSTRRQDQRAEEKAVLRDMIRQKRSKASIRRSSSSSKEPNPGLDSCSEGVTESVAVDTVAPLVSVPEEAPRQHVSAVQRVQAVESTHGDSADLHCQLIPTAEVQRSKRPSTREGNCKQSVTRRPTSIARSRVNSFRRVTSLFCRKHRQSHRNAGNESVPVLTDAHSAPIMSDCDIQEQASTTEDHFNDDMNIRKEIKRHLRATATPQTSECDADSLLSSYRPFQPYVPAVRTAVDDAFERDLTMSKEEFMKGIRREHKLNLKALKNERKRMKATGLPVHTSRPKTQCELFVEETIDEVLMSTNAGIAQALPALTATEKRAAKKMEKEIMKQRRKSESAERARLNSTAVPAARGKGRSSRRGSIFGSLRSKSWRKQRGSGDRTAKATAKPSKLSTATTAANSDNLQLLNALIPPEHAHDVDRLSCSSTASHKLSHENESDSVARPRERKETRWALPKLLSFRRHTRDTRSTAAYDRDGAISIQLTHSTTDDALDATECNPSTPTSYDNARESSVDDITLEGDKTATLSSSSTDVLFAPVEVRDGVVFTNPLAVTSTKAAEAQNNGIHRMDGCLECGNIVAQCVCQEQRDGQQERDRALTDDERALLAYSPPPKNSRCSSARSLLQSMTEWVSSARGEKKEEDPPSFSPPFSGAQRINSRTSNGSATSKRSSRQGIQRRRGSSTTLLVNIPDNPTVGGNEVAAKVTLSPRAASVADAEKAPQDSKRTHIPANVAAALVTKQGVPANSAPSPRGQRDSRSPPPPYNSSCFFSFEHQNTASNRPDPMKPHLRRLGHPLEARTERCQTMPSSYPCHAQQQDAANSRAGAFDDDESEESDFVNDIGCKLSPLPIASPKVARDRKGLQEQETQRAWMSDMTRNLIDGLAFSEKRPGDAATSKHSALEEADPLGEENITGVTGALKEETARGSKGVESKGAGRSRDPNRRSFVRALLGPIDISGRKDRKAKQKDAKSRSISSSSSSSSSNGRSDHGDGCLDGLRNQGGVEADGCAMDQIDPIEVVTQLASPVSPKPSPLQQPLPINEDEEERQRQREEKRRQLREKRERLKREREQAIEQVMCDFDAMLSAYDNSSSVTPSISEEEHKEPEENEQGEEEWILL